MVLHLFILVRSTSFKLFFQGVLQRNPEVEFFFCKLYLDGQYGADP